MKRAFLMLCAFILIFGLIGCSDGVREYVYLSGDVMCEVSFVLDKTTYRAEIERCAESCRIYFHEPPSVDGLELTSDGESFHATLCGIDVSGEAYAGLFAIAGFFEYDTRVISSALDGRAERITLERATGERFSLILLDGDVAMIDGELYGKRCEIRILRVEGEMLRS